MKFLYASVSKEAADFIATQRRKPGLRVNDTSFPGLTPLRIPPVNMIEQRGGGILIVIRTLSSAILYRGQIFFRLIRHLLPEEG